MSSPLSLSFSPLSSPSLSPRGEEVAPVKTESCWSKHKVKILKGLAIVAALSAVALAVLCWPVLLGATAAGAISATALGALATIPLAAKIMLVAGMAVFSILCATASWRNYHPFQGFEPVSMEEADRQQDLAIDGLSTSNASWRNYHLFQGLEPVSMEEADRRQDLAIDGLWTSKKTYFVPMEPNIIGVRKNEMPGCPVKSADRPRPMVLDRDIDSLKFVFPDQPNQGPDFNWRVRRWAAERAY